jgi:two-component system, chemotaxis family, response regulator PixG
LEPQGYDVLAINDPLHGIAMLLSHKPDLILLDLVMPSTNGYELCNFLRKTTVFQRTPIVILTSRDKVVDRMRAKQVGSSDFLSKPPEPDKLLSTIARLINEQSMPKPQLI